MYLTAQWSSASCVTDFLGDLSVRKVEKAMGVAEPFLQFLKCMGRSGLRGETARWELR